MIKCWQSMDAWQLHNTRTKDLALLEAMDIVPDETYPL